MILGSPPSFFTALRIAARSTTNGTPVKSWRTIRATTNGISSLAGFLAFHFASVSTSFRRTFSPSQLRSTDSSTIRMLTGNREIVPTPCSSNAGSEYRNPSRPFPASNFFNVLNSSFISPFCHPERMRRISHRVLGSHNLVCVIQASTVRFLALLGMTNSFQLSQFRFDLFEVRQLLRVVVALGVLDHAVLIHDER